MTEIFSDGAGNKYLGDCRWGNHDINYPTINYLLTGCDTTNLSLGINSLVDETSLIKGFVISQPDIDNWTGIDLKELVRFSPAGDSITNRYSFFKATLSGSGGTSSATYVRARLNNGTTAVDTYTQSQSDGGTTEIKCAGWATNNGLSLLIVRSNGTIPQGRGAFFLACKLLDVNTNFSYYNSVPGVTDSFIMSAGKLHPTEQGFSTRHYISGTGKNILESGRAAYTISCSDGQTPGAQWATDMWVYDNNAALGYPVIGRVPNMLLGIGSYTYLKPVKIQGSVFPDNGSPWYLPVGTFSGKTLLMRCYSSMS